MTMDQAQAERRSRVALSAVGLQLPHEGIPGAMAGIALETALRDWALSLGWQCEPDRQTLDKVVGWLTQHGHITADQHARLKTDARVRNHCAHGRWKLLTPGQVEHLIHSAEDWTQRVAAMGVVGQSMPNVTGQIIVAEERQGVRPALWMRWAFRKGVLQLGTLKAFSLGVILLMAPLILVGSGFYTAMTNMDRLQGIASTLSGSKGLEALTLFMPLLVLTIMLPFGVAIVTFDRGFMRFSQAKETSLAQASWVWVGRRSRSRLLRVETTKRGRLLYPITVSAECPECEIPLDFVASSRNIRASIIGECQRYPANHRYRLDPSTMRASRMQ